MTDAEKDPIKNLKDDDCAYDLKAEIGRGAFGIVYLVEHRATKKKYACKTVTFKKDNNSAIKLLRGELELYNKLIHPNVVGYYEHFLMGETADIKSIAIILQLCPGGELADKIKEREKQKKYFKESRIMNYFVQLALGLQYMHSKKILHRDLKSANVFLLDRKNLVLGDFGLSKDIESSIGKTFLGTPLHMSPEVFQQKPYASEADVWALGVLLFQMVCLQYPFVSKSCSMGILEVARKVIAGKYKIPDKVKDTYSADLISLIACLLEPNPARRPNVEAILHMDIVTKALTKYMKRVLYENEDGIRDGAVAAVKDDTTSKSFSPEVNSLMQQLDSLKLLHIVKRALIRPIWSVRLDDNKDMRFPVPLQKKIEYAYRKREKCLPFEREIVGGDKIKYKIEFNYDTITPSFKQVNCESGFERAVKRKVMDHNDVVRNATFLTTSKTPDATAARSPRKPSVFRSFVRKVLGRK